MRSEQKTTLILDSHVGNYICHDCGEKILDWRYMDDGYTLVGECNCKIYILTPYIYEMSTEELSELEDRYVMAGKPDTGDPEENVQLQE